MTEKLDPQSLHRATASIRSVAKAVAPAPWSAEVAEAVTRHHGRRRCDALGRDQLVYRAGSAVEAAGGLDLPDDALLAFFVAPEGFSWLVEEAFRQVESREGPGRGDRLIDVMRRVLDDPARRRFLIEMGVWTRFQRDREIYRTTVAAFETSPAAVDGAWRHKRPTDRQLYLIDRIISACAALGEPVPSPLPCSRGKAYDWIGAQGGNPRFWTLPEPPPELR